jgi:hypothetical protein
VFDFPASPSNGQQFSPAGGPTYVWNGTLWALVPVTPVATAQDYNRIVNGAMQHSQEWGTGGSSASGSYPADQWQHYVVGPVVASVQATNALTPFGTGTSLASNVTTAKPSLAAGDYFYYRQPIEGYRVADLQFGTPSAKPVVLRFNAYSAAAATYTARVLNGDGSRGYMSPFTVPAAQWTTIVKAIPGDTAGTWAKTNAAGMLIDFAFAAGSTYTGGTANAWQASPLVALPGTSNGVAVTGFNFQISDVGLYADPNNTGLPPPWVTPDYASELAACKRYWHLIQIDMLGTAAAANHYLGATYPFPVAMRTNAAMAQLGAGSPTNVSMATVDSATNIGCRAYIQSTAAGTFGIAGRTFTANARM